MKKRWKCVILSVCSLAMLLLSFAGCKPNVNSPGPVKPNDTSPGNDIQGGDVDAKGYIKDSLDPTLNFDNTEFCILGWNSGYDCDFYAEMDVGDTVIDSVFYRNVKVNERLGVSIKTTFIEGNNPAQATFVDTAVNSIMVNDKGEYDMIGCYSMCGGTLATRGVIQDLSQLKHLDFEKPWWSKSLIDLSGINHKLFFVTGDAANSFIYSLNFLLLNTTMMDALGVDDPRGMVRERTWTMDEMISMTKNVYVDLDDDPNQSKGDRYGFTVYSMPCLDSFIAASGIRMAAGNDENVMQLTKEFTGETTYNLITMLNQWLHGEDVYMKTDGYPVVKEGHSLFSAVAGSTIKTLRDVSYTYSVLPYPMYTRDQGSYYTLLGFTYTNFCIPINVQNPDMSAAVLECMNSEAYRSSSPTLFEECLKSRYSKDPAGDAEMYDIIKSSVYVDVNRVFSSSFVWADSAVSMFRSALYGNKTTWMSDIAGKEASINGILASISNSVG